MSDQWVKQSGFSGKTWDFNEQVELVGELLDRRDGVGKYKSVVYEIEVHNEGDRKGQTYAFFANKVLDDRLKYNKRRIKDGQGDIVRIIYLGMPAGKNYHNFDVFGLKHSNAPVTAQQPQSPPTYIPPSAPQATRINPPNITSAPTIQAPVVQPTAPVIQAPVVQPTAPVIQAPVVQPTQPSTIPISVNQQGYLYRTDTNQFCDYQGNPVNVPVKHQPQGGEETPF